MDQIPIAAVTNDHTFRGLKQHEFIILQFWRSHRTNLRSQQGCVPSGGFKREILSLPFPASRGHVLSLASSPFLHPQSLQCMIIKYLPDSDLPVSII